jgi:hypothetical protein
MRREKVVMIEKGRREKGELGRRSVRRGETHAGCEVDLIL